MYKTYYEELASSKRAAKHQAASGLSLDRFLPKDDDEDNAMWYCMEYIYGPERNKPTSWERDEIVKETKKSRGRKAGKRSKGDKGERGDRGEKGCDGDKGDKEDKGGKGGKGSKGGDNESPDRPSSESRESSPEPKPQPKPKPKPKPAPPKEVLDELQVKKINLHVEENVKQHRTDKYDITEEREGPDPKDPTKTLTLPPELVLRRGDWFLITLHLDGKFNKIANNLQIVFSFGDKPVLIKGTQVVLDMDERSQNRDVNPYKWAAQLVKLEGKTVTVNIHIPANCIVGEWNLSVRSHSIGKDKDGKRQAVISTYNHNQEIAILFNPWCEDVGSAKEYVLNDTGCVFRGNQYSPSAKEWNFGQFEEPCFEASLYLLRMGSHGMSASVMSDPVKVSRILAQMVNAPGDNGVLVGNWSGNYDDGIPPSTWVGSVNILTQYNETKEPVKYGQCWVFSGLVTTVCRTLGIPCRSVTNFASAHDTEGSNTIDKFYYRTSDNTREFDKTRTFDSVWNFHVWNEVWLRRTDLGKVRYDGWQVIDATPQELSGGVYTCGPCPVAAVKAGQCDIDFDTGFVFSEVNADKVMWENTPGGIRKFRTYKSSIGKIISTKIPDGLALRDKVSENISPWELTKLKRLDITNEYKHMEGSPAERRAVKQAWKTAVNPREELYDDREELLPIELEFKYSSDVLIGSDFDINVVAKNPGKYDRTIDMLTIRVFSEAYTGDMGDPWLNRKFENIKVSKDGDATTTLTLTCRQYLFNIVEQGMLYFEAEAHLVPLPNAKPDFSVMESDVFRLRYPDIRVTGPSEGKVGEAVKFDLCFTNPLPQKLTKIDVSAESTSGFKNIMNVKQEDVEEGGVFKSQVSIVPKKKGEHTVTFSFDSRTLKDITGSKSVVIA